jgi:multidrug efflux pump subunit AcrA (membrane-fusion protein)
MKMNFTFRDKPSSLGAFMSLTGLILVILIFTSSCGKKEEPPAPQVIRPVKTMTVSAGTDISGLTLPGTVRASRRVELAFKEVGGRLIELPIEGREGREVKQDELLARIDPKDFETDLSRVQGRLKEAVASLDLAKAEYERVKRIQKKDPGAVSMADVDRRLSYTYLKAPFSGLIAQRFVDNFQDVKPKQPILALEDISHIEILINVPENVVAVARDTEDEKIKAVAQFPTAPGNQFELQLKEYATRADTATQTYQAVLQMPQPEDLNIFPGMTATVTLSLGSSAAPDSSILIPAIAVVAKPDGSSFVWEVDAKDMTVHQRDVKVGPITGSENIRILEGLKGGEKIAVAGVLKLQEGMKVRFWEK